MRIKELRIASGLSQKELAGKLGIKPNTLSQYETEKRSPDPEMLKKIADFFEVSIDYLIGNSDYKNLGEYFDEKFDSELLAAGVKLWDKIIPLLKKYGYEIEEDVDGTYNIYHDGEFYTNTDESTILSRYMASKNKDELTAEDLVYKYPENAFPIKTKKFPLIGEIACGEPILAEQHFEGYVEAGADIRADFCIRARGDSMVNIRVLDGDIVFVREQSDVENGEIAAVLINNEATLKRVNKNVPGFLQLMPENPDYEPIVINLKEPTEIRIMGKAVAFQSDIK